MAVEREAAAKTEQELRAAAQRAETEKQAAKRAEEQAKKEKDEAERKAADQARALAEAKAFGDGGGAAYYASFKGDFELPVPKSQLKDIGNKESLFEAAAVRCIDIGVAFTVCARAQVWAVDLSRTDDSHKSMLALVHNDLGPALSKKVKRIQVCAVAVVCCFLLLRFPFADVHVGRLFSIRIGTGFSLANWKQLRSDLLKRPSNVRLVCDSI